MRHDLMRAVGGQRPFMLMEQTPSRQNWQPYCAQKYPGQMRQQSWQAVAHGANSVQFFQLRQNRSGCEKFHGAVITSDNTDKTRTFREIAQLGDELHRVSAQLLDTQPEHGQIGVVFDWPTWWGIGFSAGPTHSLEYDKEVLRWYGELHRRNIPTDMVPAAGPFDGYEAIVAPCLYMVSDETIAALRSYVERGGRLLLTPMSLLADEHDSLFQGETPVPLRDLAGIWVEETDALAPDTTVPLYFVGNDFACGGEILCDILIPDRDTQILAFYNANYYAQTPAFTFKSSTGNGGVFYSAVMPDAAALPAMVDALTAGINLHNGTDVPLGIEITRRYDAVGTEFLFVMNPASIEMSMSMWCNGLELLSGNNIRHGDTVTITSYGVLIIKIDKGPKVND